MSDESIFWDNFRQRSLVWASLLKSGNQEAVFEEIDKLLDKCRLPYCFDITHDNAL
jgi:hypothetical protein